MTLAAEAGSKDLKIVRGACPHDCPDTCAMLYHVVDGKLVDLFYPLSGTHEVSIITDRDAAGHCD